MDPVQRKWNYGHCQWTCQVNEYDHVQYLHLLPCFRGGDGENDPWDKTIYIQMRQWDGRCHVRYTVQLSKDSPLHCLPIRGSSDADSTAHFILPRYIYTCHLIRHTFTLVLIQGGKCIRMYGGISCFVFIYFGENIFSIQIKSLIMSRLDQ